MPIKNFAIKICQIPKNKPHFLFTGWNPTIYYYNYYLLGIVGSSGFVGVPAAGNTPSSKILAVGFLDLGNINFVNGLIYWAEILWEDSSN